MYFNIYGCGFAGMVSSLGLCSNNIEVNAVDIDQNKIISLQNNDLTQIPLELHSSFKQHHGKNLNFYATGHEPTAPQAHILTVPTPLENNQLNLRYVHKCLKHIFSTSSQNQELQIIIRSTLPINAMDEIYKELANHYNSKNLKLFYIPEFMREGTGLDDWSSPPLSIIGLDNSVEPPQFIQDLFKHTKLTPMSFNEAISVKLLSNAYHAMKVSFANEALRICQKNNISAKKVMSEFCKDTKLNISDKYLKPGFAWGGSCLEKDTTSLISMRSDLPLLQAVIDSNKSHIQFLKNKILNYNINNISVIGLGFKENTNDLRESPVIELINEFLPESKIKSINILEDTIDLLSLFKNHQKIKQIKHIDQIGTNDFVLIHKKVSQNSNIRSTHSYLEL